MNGFSVAVVKLSDIDLPSIPNPQVIESPINSIFSFFSDFVRVIFPSNSRPITPTFEKAFSESLTSFICTFSDFSAE